MQTAAKSFPLCINLRSQVVLIKTTKCDHLVMRTGCREVCLLVDKIEVYGTKLAVIKAPKDMKNNNKVMSR